MRGGDVGQAAAKFVAWQQQEDCSYGGNRTSDSTPRRLADKQKPPGQGDFSSKPFSPG
jgi:hypothetical protein